eukprot:CAMPEP_0185734498 /NCGR_PEP_ID=MMETSP1171-20130828/22711_1 /TAXON_ID=374046 /ORGANISM="Helicotheca tamensis, Strain CCMP826" /LENGTH=404 /DNA_ID=CAMNT_0028404509 /DNA_START=14 /DNA_END=1225 /DNA_ORIENTATION=-
MDVSVETSKLFAVVIVACTTLLLLKLWNSNSSGGGSSSSRSLPAGSKFVTISNDDMNDSIGIKIRYEEHTPSSSSSSSSPPPSKEDANKEYEKDKAEEGVTILLIHGHLGCLETWNLLLPHLLLLANKENQKIKKIITLDAVGHGYSDKPTKFTYSYYQQGDVLYQFLEQLNITNAVLVGHSSGCIIASCVASIDSSSSTSKPKRVKGVILTAPGGLFSVKPSFLSWTIMYPFCYFLAKTSLTNRRASLIKYHLNTDCLMKNDEQLIKYFVRPSRLGCCDDISKGDKSDKNDDKDVVDKEAITVTAAIFAVKEKPYLQYLHDIETSSVFIHFVLGAQDSIYDIQNDKEKKQKLNMVVDELNDKKKQSNSSYSKIIVVDDTNHYMQHEQPEKLAKIILNLVNDER